jgi:DNA-binding NarL/FixJ family response regulator
VRFAFEFEDFNVYGEASNGQDALQKAGQLKPDLIVLDLSMPVMNRIATCLLLRRLIPTARLILFTLHESATTQSEAWAAGFSSIISKHHFSRFVT